MLEVLANNAVVRTRLHIARRRGASVGFVPTMGALHAGHAKLLQLARQENDVLVASIFVNPIQFDREEDLETYPRSMGHDRMMCEEEGVDFIFAPSAAELYPLEQLTFVDSPALTRNLCGAHRAGHFRGVATVVLKLFNIVQPTRAYFGKKDAQQLVVIQRMVADLNLPVAVVPVATVREHDGLALSSRNKHLTIAQRQIAPVLFRALEDAVSAITRGERDAEAVIRQVVVLFAQYPEARVEYFDIVHAETLAPVKTITGPVLIAGAMWLGSTRLIDNASWPL